MSAKHSSSSFRIVTGAVARLTLLLFVAPIDAAEEAPPVAAVWKARELSFFYRTDAMPFPCHELQGRVTQILRAVGARDDVKVDVSDCDHFIMQDDDFFQRSDPFETRSDPFRTQRRPEREQSAHVRVRLMMPIAVTPAVLAEIDRDKSRRELISRVTGNPIAALNDPIVFEAQRQAVTLSRPYVRLEPKDCQLLEQMSRGVFRDLGVRVLRRNFSCDSGEMSRVTPQMTVETLVPTGNIVVMPEAEKGEQKSKAPELPGSPESPASDAAPAENTTEPTPQ